MISFGMTPSANNSTDGRTECTGQFFSCSNSPFIMLADFLKWYLCGSGSGSGGECGAVSVIATTALTISLPEIVSVASCNSCVLRFWLELTD